MNQDYRQFMELNYGNKIKHMFADFESQVRDRFCVTHPGCHSCKGCGTPELPMDLAVLGTPCPPFSQARTKRWADGSVEAHRFFATTFGTTYDFLERQNPAAVILEQVEGFDLPFSQQDATTPKQRCPAVTECTTYLLQFSYSS